MEKEFRVIGPPGTGKTTFLTKQVQNAAAKFGTPTILIASLTRAAAAEIAGRNNTLKKHQVGTLHSHAYRSIGSPDLAEEKEAIKEWNKYITLKGKPFWKLTGGVSIEKGDIDGVMKEDTAGDKLLNEINLNRARMRAIELWKPQEKRFFEAWEDFKDASSLVDFTDMIDLALKNVEVAPGAPMNFFLDEAQDMDLLEISLARKWGKYCTNFIIAGDPDQNLYEWRGSDSHVFNTPELPEENYRILEQSYRVPRAVHEYATRWIQQVQDRRPVSYKPRDEDGGLYKNRGGYENPEPIIKLAQELTDQGKTVMILGSCSYMIDPIRDMLKENGIPFHNPYRKSRGDWNPVRMGDNSTLNKLSDYLKASQEQRTWTIPELLNWADLVKKSGIFKHGILKELEKDSENQFPIPKNILKEIVFEPMFEISPMLRGDLSVIKENVTKAKEKSIDFPIKILKKNPNNTEPKIIIGTGHSVKGGEADAVFILPDISRAFANMAMKQKGRDALYRLFYVMITRARESVYLCQPSGPFNMKWIKP